MKITVIVGLPGSGKSHYGNSLSFSIGHLFFDDCVTDLEVWEAAEACILAGQDCILADPGFCIDRQKKKLLDKLATLNPNAQIEFIYFANEPDICAENVSTRTDGRAVSKRFAYDLSKWYTVPAGVPTIPCYRKSEE